MSEDKSRTQFISPQPRLAILLRAREPRVFSRGVWDWSVDWVQDVGSILRDRGFITYSMASFASYGVLLVVAELFPATRKFGIISKAMGIAER